MSSPPVDGAPLLGLNPMHLVRSCLLGHVVIHASFLAVLRQPEQAASPSRCLSERVARSDREGTHCFESSAAVSRLFTYKRPFLSLSSETAAADGAGTCEQALSWALRTQGHLGCKQALWLGGGGDPSQQPSISSKELRGQSADGLIREGKPQT